MNIHKLEKAKKLDQEIQWFSSTINEVYNSYFTVKTNNNKLIAPHLDKDRFDKIKEICLEQLREDRDKLQKEFDDL